ncbi:hypothetical protein VTJ83DRAFT_3926 [Remersonia thermophila]|uniref:Ketoreductase domain-containing protein n=1 Tax=Remersonia thermophila TaxID=72144 RepID=A0ABR4DFI5_9PEZI
MSAPSIDDPWSIVHMTNLSGPVDLSKTYDPASLAGKTILITGGASGFGAAFARHWAAHGAHIVVGDVNDALGEALVAELRTSPTARPDQFIAYQRCDVTSWADQVRLFRAAAAGSPTKRIDAVVAGAGIADATASFDKPQNLDDESAIPPPPPLRVLGVNLTGVMYTTHLALHYLAQDKPAAGSAKRDRHLLLISSIAGLHGLPGQTEYTASKHAVMGVFRALRAAAGLFNRPASKAAGSGGGGDNDDDEDVPLRVNVLCPYFVATPILTAATKALLAGAALGEVEDVVDAATRLMADDGIRGRALVVGPKMRVVDVTEGDEYGETVRIVEGEPAVPGRPERRQAVWEVYGHDYQRVEAFIWRYLAALNLMSGLRGWVGIVKDILGICFGGAGSRRG